MVELVALRRVAPRAAAQRYPLGPHPVVSPLNAPAPPKQLTRQGAQLTSLFRNHSTVMRLWRREGAAGLSQRDNRYQRPAIEKTVKASYLAPGVLPSPAAATFPFLIHSHIRPVYRRRLAAPGPEAGGSLQHPVAQAAEAGPVSTGFDRPVRPPSTAEDQATHRAAISSCRGKTGARAAREGRRDRQDRARVQRVIP